MSAAMDAIEAAVKLLQERNEEIISLRDRLADVAKGAQKQTEIVKAARYLVMEARTKEEKGAALVATVEAIKEYDKSQEESGVAASFEIGDDGRCCPEMKPWLPHTHGEGSAAFENLDICVDRERMVSIRRDGDELVVGVLWKGQDWAGRVDLEGNPKSEPAKE